MSDDPKNQSGETIETDVDVDVEANDTQGAPLKEPQPPNEGRESVSTSPTNTVNPGGDVEEDDKDLNKPVIGNGGEYDKADDADDSSKKKKIIGGIILLVALFALLLALGLTLPKDDPAPKAAGLVTKAPTTAAKKPFEEYEYSVPSVMPISSSPTATKSPVPEGEPTPLPTTESPSNVPTKFPTPATGPPTFSLPGPKSRLPCDEIRAHPTATEGNQGGNNFKNYTLDNGDKVCADTYAGPDPIRENRNVWNAVIGRRDCVFHNYVDGALLCDSVGARRCSADELAQAAGQGSGCGGDNELLYSNTECTSNGQDGIYSVNFALKTMGTFFRCETDLSWLSITRCCGDISLDKKKI